MATTTSEPTTTMSCSFCQTHSHTRCVGTVHDPVAKFPLTCACAARKHDPDVETAARMRVAQCFTARTNTVEQNATAYRKAER
jgi:hypothetical protein